jgi:hypothetical protein
MNPPESDRRTSSAARPVVPGDAHNVVPLKARKWSAAVTRAMEAVMEIGGCGDPSPDGTRVCIQPAGHDAPCTWDMTDG